MGIFAPRERRQYEIWSPIDADDDMLERRHGYWERLDDERADLLDDVPWLARVDGEHIAPHVAPAATARFDAAGLAAVRLPLATLLGGVENERGSNE